MYRVIEENKDELLRLCAMHGVRSLSLFGSATTDRFDPAQSDLDFLVEFKPMSPEERADHYFGLMEDFQALFGITVDLVEAVPIRNPFFRAAVEESRISLYDAA
jgi:predicted nucleotidyltransferase